MKLTEPVIWFYIPKQSNYYTCEPTEWICDHVWLKLKVLSPHEALWKIFKALVKLKSVWVGNMSVTVWCDLW